MVEYVKVPVHVLQEVEQARKHLYSVLEQDGFFEREILNTICLTEITQPIWYVANRKWEKINETTSDAG